MKPHSQPTVLVASLKGGVGKTTTAFHLAKLIGATLVDLDPERSTLAWREHGLTITRDGCGIEGPVVYDTPPNDRELLMELAPRVTHIIIPLAPGQVEIDRAQNTLRALRAAAPNLSAKIGVLITLSGNDNLSKAMPDVLARYRGTLGYHYDIIGSIPRSVAFQRAAIQGMQTTLEPYRVVSAWL